MLDVRFPIGALFFILGIMIAAWGYTHPPIAAIAAKMGPLPINFDIIWGILMTIFGLAMFSLAKLDAALAMEREYKEEMAKAAASVDKPESIESLAQDCGDTPVHDSGDTPAQDCSDTPAHDSGDTPAQDSGDTPAQDCGDTPAQDCGDTPAENLGASPVESSGDKL